MNSDEHNLDEEVSSPANEAVLDDMFEASNPPIVKPRKGVRLLTVLFWSFLAAVIGAAAGAGLSPYAQKYMPGGGVKSETAKLQTQIEKGQADAVSATKGLNEKIAALQTRVAAVEAAPHNSALATNDRDVDADVLARIAALENRSSVDGDPPQSNPAAPAVISAIEERLTALENADVPETISTDLTLIEDRLAALETAPTDKSGDANFEETLTSRVEALENAPKPVFDSVDLSPITARLDALEAKRAAAEAARAAAPVPPFPSNAVITAMSTDPDAKKGWLSRTMNKHVKVRDESAVEMVAHIEGLLAEGRVAAAVAKAEDLPVDGVTAAQEWIDLVKTQRLLP